MNSNFWSISGYGVAKFNWHWELRFSAVHCQRLSQGNALNDYGPLFLISDLTIHLARVLPSHNFSFWLCHATLARTGSSSSSLHVSFRKNWRDCVDLYKEEMGKGLFLSVQSNLQDHPLARQPGLICRVLEHGAMWRRQLCEECRNWARVWRGIVDICVCELLTHTLIHPACSCISKLGPGFVQVETRSGRFGWPAFAAKCCLWTGRC